MKKINVKELARKTKFQIVEYWKKPRPGEYISNREFVCYAFASSGIQFYQFMNQQGFGFAAGSIFAGAVMGIRPVDFVTIGLIGTIFGYLFVWMTPLNMLIYENHGVLQRKTKRFAHIAMALKLTAAAVLYCLPSSMFEQVIKGLPQILANSLVVSVFNFYTDWVVRRKFSKKYGRLKPFMLIYGVPIILLSTAIAFVPPKLEYTKKLVVLHLLFNLLGTMTADYNQTDSLVKFMSPNSQERQRLYSYVPTISFLFTSALGVIYPFLIGGRQNEAWVFRLFVPLCTTLGVALVFCLISVKERVIEDTRADVQKVKFVPAAKMVYRDGYLWMYKINTFLSVWDGLYTTIISLWFLYTLRISWFTGIAVEIVGALCILGYVTTPMLTKRFTRKNLYLLFRSIHTVLVACLPIALKLQSVPLYIFISMLNMYVNVVLCGVNQAMLPEILDRHQWKYGERCDSTMGVIDWIFSPLGMAVGYILPFMLKSVGFTSDWDILYDANISSRVFMIYIIMSVISSILMTVPYIFYGITNESHKQMIEDIQKRVNESMEKSVDEITEEFSGAGKPETPQPVTEE